MPIEQALTFTTSNVAGALGIKGHGVIETGACANACLFTEDGVCGLAFCDVSTGAFRNTRSRSSKLLASHARTPKTAKGFVSSLVSKISITFPSRRKPARFSTCGKKRSFAERAVLCRLESVIPSRHSVNCA